MIVAMMQPSFLPWQGFFELLLKSDKFIILDDFQFSVQSYHQRNRLFVNKEQVDWYTVPVKKKTSFMLPLNQVAIDENSNWRIKVWKRLQFNYAKAPYYGEFASWIENWLFTPFESIAAQNIAFIIFVSELFKYKGSIKFSSENPSVKVRSERVVELLTWAKANTYLCAKGSYGYMNEDGVFPSPDIEVLFQDFNVKEYEQIGSKNMFMPNLSVLDALMNIGVVKTRELIMLGTPTWKHWEEMKLLKMD
jgi:hypothetical protein